MAAAQPEPEAEKVADASATSRGGDTERMVVVGGDAAGAHGRHSDPSSADRLPNGCVFSLPLLCYTPFPQVAADRRGGRETLSSVLMAYGTPSALGTV
jgi:hypothetical protein